MPTDNSLPTTPRPPVIVEEESISPTPPVMASTSSDPQVSPIITSSNKKKYAGGKVIATILGLFVLVGGLGAGIFLVQQQQLIDEKAYTNVTDPPTDSCSFVQVSASDNASCPRLEGNTGTNNVSSHSTVYSIKNITDTVHTVSLTKKSNFCTEPYGQTDPALPNWPVCYSSTMTTTQSLTLNPNETKTVTITRSSDRGMSCGSYQTDLYINSVDGNVNCHGRDNNGLIAASLCQTGTTCSGDTTGSSYCQQIKAYKEDWTLLTNVQLTALKAGDKVNFCATGVAASGSFDKGRFTINGTVRPETTTKRPGSQDFCYTYEIPADAGTFNVTAELHHTTLGWK